MRNHLDQLEARRLLSASVSTDLAPLSDNVAVVQAWDRGLASPAAEGSSTRWIVRDSGQSARDLADALGVAHDAVRPWPSLPGVQVLDLPQPVDAARLATLGLRAEQVQAVRDAGIGPRFVPDDPFVSGQWHLDASNSAAVVDANVFAAWDVPAPADTRIDGTGIVIGVLDDGVVYTHPDLVDNYDQALDYDYLSNDDTPLPFSFDGHGTSVAGVAAAVGNNAVGVSGVAFDATLAGLRIYGGSSGGNDIGIGGALQHLANDIDVYNNSWGPSDDGKRFEGPGPLSAAALEFAATQGRGGLGSVHVWAGGNGGLNDDVNRDGYANSRFSIAVAALNNYGQRSWYSEEGSSLIVTAPSNGGSLGITTVSSTNASGYTNSFGGTSSAAPLVSGVVALMLEANPLLSYRDVQHVLIESAAPVDAASTGWSTNAAGYDVNLAYGFGLVDAAAAVSVASTWQTVAPEVTYTSAAVTDPVAIPDGGTIDLTFDVPSGLTVEHVDLGFDVSHNNRGDLQVLLTSPGGTVSRLLDNNNDNGDNISNWTLNTVRNWGEDSGGTWTVNVSDTSTNGIPGTLNLAQLRVYGAGVIAAPTVEAASFDGATRHAIVYDFDRPFPNDLLTTEGLTLINTLTGESYTTVLETLESESQLATFVVTGGLGTTTTASGKVLLPDGRYIAELPVGLADLDGRAVMAEPLSFNVLAGDANGDATVSILDFAILRANFGSTASTFYNGDFNYDGTVSILDFAILRSTFGNTLPDTPASLFDDA